MLWMFEIQNKNTKGGSSFEKVWEYTSQVPRPTWEVGEPDQEYTRQKLLGKGAKRK